MFRNRLLDDSLVAISCGQQEGFFRGFDLTGSFGVLPPGEPFFLSGGFFSIFVWVFSSFCIVFELLFEFFNEVVDGAFDEGVVLRVVVHRFDFDGVGEFFLK